MKSLGYPLYVNGKLFEQPVTISHVPTNAVGTSDRDPSFGGVGRMSGLGQYVQYYPNLGADDAAALPEPSGWVRLAAVIGPVFAGLGIYHGYKRNESIGWALGWGVMTAAFPVIMIPVALAQGFGEKKAMRANRSRKRKRARRRARRSNPKKRDEVVYVFMGRIERGSGRGKPSFRWVDGYSRGGNTYPWLTKREAQQEAKREGKKAVFR